VERDGACGKEKGISDKKESRRSNPVKLEMRGEKGREYKIGGKKGSDVRGRRENPTKE